MARMEGGRLLAGTARLLGVRAPWSLTVDSRGAFDWSIGGDWGERAVFDGAEALGWDWAGAPRPLEMFDLEARSALVWAITGAPEAESGGAWTRLNAQLERDRSGSPSALVYDAQSGAETWRFEGVRDSQGWTPTALRKIVGDVEMASIVVKGGWRRSPGRVTLPHPEEPTDFRIDERHGSRVETHKGPYGHLLVRASVAGAEPGWFILDSGASSSTLSPETARGARLEAQGGGLVVTALGPARTPLYRPSELRVGPLTLEKPRFIELALDGFGDAFGVPVAGILGWEVLRRSVVEIDFHEPSVDIRRAPAGATGTEDVDWKPVRFNMQHPVVEGGLAGRPARLRLDIGMGGGVAAILHGGALERLQIQADLSGDRVPLGSGSARTGTIESLELAGAALRPARVVLPDADASCVFRDPYVEATVGHRVLSSFGLVFDYPRGRVGFRRRNR